MAQPQASGAISVRDHFDEVDEPVTVIPRLYELTGEMSKTQGELAEKAVCEMIKKCSKSIPGIKIVTFHGARVIGGSPPDTTIKEVDQCTFITYQDRHYILVKEVKCNAISEKSGPTRKKAISQLKAFSDLLKSKLNVSTDQIQFHAVWPNMEPRECCSSCLGSHPSLYEKPGKCRQPGTQERKDPEHQGFHVFKDKFVGDAFSDWIMSIVSDPSKAVEQSDYDSVLEFVVRHTKGVLFDETAKSFCIPGEDQTKLIEGPEQDLTVPTIIYGLAGTGKTISVLARIQKKSSLFSDSCKALYLCLQDNARAMVERKLRACNVDLSHITLADFKSFPLLTSLPHDDAFIQGLINDNFRYIYIDSAEDMGIDWLNAVVAKALRKEKGKQNSCVFGDFWVTLDPFQSSKDTHFLAKTDGDQLQWQGSLLKFNFFSEDFNQRKLIKLGQCFRLPLAMLHHVEEEKLLPTSDLPQARDVRSMGWFMKTSHF